MSNVKHMIWANDVCLEEWKDALADAGLADASDCEKYEHVYDLNNQYLDDERMNLDIVLKETILSIASIGRWNGRFQGYKEIESGNIADCLYTECESAKWFVDAKGDLCGTFSHHDGTNHVSYRVWKESVSDDTRERVLSEYVRGERDEISLRKYTSRLGDVIGDVYGWTFPGRRPKVTVL